MLFTTPPPIYLLPLSESTFPHYWAQIFQMTRLVERTTNALVTKDDGALEEVKKALIQAQFLGAYEDHWKHIFCLGAVNSYPSGR